MSQPVVLVTGASGLIGSNLVDLLLEKGFFVVGLAKAYPLSSYGLAQFSNTRYLPILGDVCSAPLLRDLLDRYQPRYMIHLAAQALVENAGGGVMETFETNLKGTWRLLDAARTYGCLDRIIIASSDKAYGEHAVLPYRESYQLNARYPYELSKKLSEEIAMSYFHSYGLPLCITRCGNVFGSYDLNASRLVPGTILSCLRDEPVHLRSNGLQQRCYVHASDVASAYLSLMIGEPEKIVGQSFNVGNNRALSVVEMVSLICAKMGRGMDGMVVENGGLNEISRQSLDCQKIKDAVGWEEGTSLNDALDMTIAWYTHTFPSGVMPVPPRA